MGQPPSHVDRLHIVGIVLVEPPQEQDAVGVHVGDDDVETPFCLLDERFVVEDIAQADQPVEPVSAAFIGPAALAASRDDCRSSYDRPPTPS